MLRAEKERQVDELRLPHLDDEHRPSARSAPDMTTLKDHRRLSVELEAALVRALLRAWHGINETHFGGMLIAPQLMLVDADRVLGQWDRRSRSIAISRSLVLDHPWGVVVEVLKHEVAHQYVEEAVGADHPAHGDAFRNICTRLGIDAASRGLPRAKSEDDGEARLRRRIAKLLALAESPNGNEADSAMREAQRLMLKHNIDVSAAEGDRAYGFRQLGEPTGRIQPQQKLVGAILSRFFFVEAIWVEVYRPLEATYGRVLEVCGTDANLEMATYVYDFLLSSSERLWREHKRVRGISGDSDRRSFLVGVMRGFYDKLEAQNRRNKEEGLVWLKDGEFAQYYRRRYPRTTSMRPATHARAGAFREGTAAGRELVLHKPVHDSGTAPVRLLGGRVESAR